MNANLYESLRRFAEESPDRLALIHRGRALAYGDFRARVERRAAELRRCGVGKGDRVVIFVPMGIALYEILLAVFAIGAVAVFLDAWADPKRLDYAAQLAEAKAYIAIPKAYLLLLKSKSLRRIPVRLFPWFGRRDASADFVPADCVPEDPALITFTTGSTGVPKAALRTCGFLWAQHEALTESLDVREGDVDLATLPIFALNNIACGVTTLIPAFNPARPAEIDPARVAAEARSAGVTTTAGSPAFYRRLAQAACGGEPDPDAPRAPRGWRGGLSGACGGAFIGVSRDARGRRVRVHGSRADRGNPGGGARCSNRPLAGDTRGNSEPAP